MRDQAGYRFGLVWVFGVFVGVGVILIVWLGKPATPPAPPDEPTVVATFPLPPFSESRYLNAAPDVAYVGSAACAACHQQNHQSYLHTAHSRALSDVNPAAEPPDGAFDHRPSGRSYRVYRKDGQLRHEELLQTAEGKEIARVDLPVRYLVGSGHFSRTYLVEVDGFLHESPITWYASKQKWDLSPGYDFPQHVSFERPAGVECLGCHAGRVEELGGTLHRLTFLEKAIGCENCHGPGSLHQERHRAGKFPRGQEDLTIVHPGKLSRPLQEAICASCHLSGPALVPVRGHQPIDYRPGRPLSDYRIHYQFDGGSEQMMVVGHVEQLRQSLCYQKSADLTCVSCHDPHRGEEPRDKVAFYREKCVHCHTTKPCKVEPGERLKKEASDNCVSCHMPRGDTEIPHIAFTHHRIGVHGGKPATVTGRIPELMTADDVGFLRSWDQERNLGLAYLKVSRNPAYFRFAGAFRERARERLEGVTKSGLRDGEMALALADLYWQGAPVRATTFARQALEDGGSVQVRTMALTILASCDFQGANYERATSSLEELVRLRRIGEDWRMLGVSYLRQNKPEQALTALRQAVAIRPFRATVQSGLGDTYRRLGDLPRSKEHLEKAQWLLSHKQD